MIRLAERDEFTFDKELTITLTKGDLIQLYCAIGDITDEHLEEEVTDYFGESVALALSDNVDTFSLYADIKEILRREGMDFV